MLGLVFLLVLSSCAPSMRVAYRSTVFFEHCHIADFDPDTELEFKSECWDRWLRYYAEGQPPDRRIYAWERRAALQMGDEPPQLLSTSTTASLDPLSPAQTIPSAPDDATDAATVVSLDDRPAPASPCERVCSPARTDCLTRCDEHERSCEQACAREYGFCVGGCI
jgi:hypothetical protein